MITVSIEIYVRGLVNKMEFLRVRDGIELFYKKDLSKEPKGVILINHGFAEHSGRYDYVANVFSKGGYNVYRYDLRAHGKSKSELGLIESFNDFINDADEMVDLIINENKKLPIFMLGHSMGGLINALYGFKFKDKIKGQIFSGAALGTLPSAKGIKSNFLVMGNVLFKNTMIKNPIDDALCSDRDVFQAYLDDPLVLNKASLNFYVEFLINSIKKFDTQVKDYSLPCFITHGEEDRVVPKELSLSFYDRISSSDKEIKIYKNLYHEILNEKEKDQILKDMIQWLDNRI